MKINGWVFPSALTVSVILGAVAYGEQKSTVNDHNRRIEQLEKTPLRVQAIDKKQVEINTRVEALDREQRIFRQDTKEQLRRILDELRR